MSVRKEVSSMAAPCSSSNVSEQFMVADWDPLHSAGGSNVMSSYNAGSDQIPSFAGFGNENLCELMGSFVLPESTSLCPQDDFPCTNELANDKNLKGKKRKKLPEHGSPMSVEGENAKSPMEKDDKKEPSKEDYIHIRAKRGQATNSHSLAERVRREKISERMRLLQDLVPGCNKITGKAVMLDEIINYVQSLQKQVEFLSMKLSTVNPEINLDTEQIFTKENLHSIRYGSSAAFGYGPELGMPHRHLQAEIAMPSRPNSTDFLRIANAHTSHMPQISGSWDHEFQNALQMGFIPNLHYDGTDMTGSRKTEL